MGDYSKLDKIINEQIFIGQAFDFNDEKKEIYKSRVEYFNEFFDTSRMSADEIYNFICNEEQEHIIFKTNVIGLLHFNKNDCNECFDQYFSEEGKEKFLRDFVDNTLPFRQFYRDFVKAILWISFYNPLSNNQITDEDFSKDDIEIIDEYRGKKNGYFRGQSNFLWQLKPSLLRGFEFVGKDGCVIDSNKLFEIYDSVGLIKKYNNTIGDSEIKTGSDIDYNFLSFMQHSISYSPLIDFTGRIEVAYKFALQRNDPNTYLHKDSSVFIISFEKTNPVEDFSKLNIVFLNKKIKPGSVMQVVDSTGKIKWLDFTTINKIKKLLCPKFVCLDVKTNDRMKYQNGKFVLFYDYVSVKGNLYYMLNKQIAIFKRKIKVSEKNKILKSIDDSLNTSYLMNPYQIFND